MIFGGGALRAYICAEPVDMRKSIDGLAQLVEPVFQADVFCGQVFVFVGKRRNKVKMLWWDRHGFFLLYNSVRAIKAGQMRAILATTANRLPYLPNVPGISEAGVDLAALDPYTMAGFVGPAGMPAEVVARLNEVINQVSRMPDVIAVMREQLYSEPMVTTPASFRSFLEKQIATWREIGRKAKLALPE